MAEKEPKRGRPRKNEGQNQSGQTTPTPEAGAGWTTQTTTQVVVENPVEQATHKFMKAVYKEGADIVQALSVAQDEFFTTARIIEAFQALHSLVTLGLEEARERGSDESVIGKLTNQQRAFSSALKRLNPITQAAGELVGPTDPSNLPPMTGRKG